MPSIIALVEGDGEVEAVPVLIRRIAAEVSAPATADVRRPVRVPRGRLPRPGTGGDRGQAGAGSRILILLDANSRLPGQDSETRSDRRIEVVLAKRGSSPRSNP